MVVIARRACVLQGVQADSGHACESGVVALAMIREIKPVRPPDDDICVLGMRDRAAAAAAVEVV